MRTNLNEALLFRDRDFGRYLAFLPCNHHEKSSKRGFIRRARTDYPRFQEFLSCGALGRLLPEPQLEDSKLRQIGRRSRIIFNIFLRLSHKAKCTGMSCDKLMSFQPKREGANGFTATGTSTRTTMQLATRTTFQSWIGKVDRRGRISF